jgi:Uma2 family endonuclease
MSADTSLHPVTADDFAAMPDTKGFELVDGELVELSMSVDSSFTAGEVLAIGRAYCHSRNLGIWLPPDTGIRCFADDPDRIRKPDACFIRRERFTPELRQVFLPVAPDLVVEVVSPTDRHYEVDAKVEEYLAAGVSIVWVINPASRIARVHRSGAFTGVYENDELEAEPVIPGFRCRLGDVLLPRLN